ncbi:FkbM family methyltransferase [Chitinophaga sp. MD30]|uniref:FkbM family methyltransferase n=1 Tax=Chitinophaga sp. MD30 TaxID=2033437 RepID=UPI000BAF9960|nr:FkbM family methyltransferase [Chitinophaga sp. MD30]ASZ14204.1 FkbM family methyltransferase [Chitinophaga sp. MD30]
MNPLTASVKKIYVYLFARKAFYNVNLYLYKLSMRGLGILNYENETVSGEKAFVKQMVAGGKLMSGVVLDIGANHGNYAAMLRKLKVKLPIFAFEPHPAAFAKLEQTAAEYDFTAIQQGASNETTTALIYDYAGGEGSEHASMYKEVIAGFRNSAVDEVHISLTTIDEFVETNHISRIALLKIDTEGNELNVLKGARQTIAAGLIDAVQVEFNEMNVIARTFLKDIITALPGYDFYRLLPNGLLPLGKYVAANLEIFAFQNIVALRKKISKHSGPP